MEAGDDPHDKVRSLPSAIEQSDRFLRSGVVENDWGGVCTGM